MLSRVAYIKAEAVAGATTVVCLMISALMSLECNCCFQR